MRQQPRPAIQLYSLYELSPSLPELVRRAAAAGFEGVEFSHRFGETEIGVLATALNEAGIEPIAIHADLQSLEAAVQGETDLLEKCVTISCDRVILSHSPSRYFRSHAAVGTLASILATIARELDDHGLTLGYHTSRHEFRPVLPNAVEALLPETIAKYAWGGLARANQLVPIPGSAGFWTLADRTESFELQFEIDTAEVIAAGYNPVDVITRLSDRITMLHMRDIALTGRLGRYESMWTGEGDLDISGIREAAAEANVEWIVYENEIAGSPEAKLTEGPALVGASPISR